MAEDAVALPLDIEFDVGPSVGADDVPVAELLPLDDEKLVGGSVDTLAKLAGDGDGDPVVALDAAALELVLPAPPAPPRPLSVFFPPVLPPTTFLLEVVTLSITQLPFASFVLIAITTLAPVPGSPLTISPTWYPPTASFLCFCENPTPRPRATPTTTRTKAR